ncbi:DinB family protein [Hymenobacter sp. DG25A]|uniref:DinB family protein n=1 Tax=Hymenobacter sp. DG25A TaxID=1385663 RepID=UPI000B0B7E6F|nr:DinB family protein [Hymenobacter sp. DG25A]
MPTSTILAHEAVARLQEMLSVLNAHLRSFSEEEMERPLAPGKWSRKEILGHMIDSACNNHRRFVLCQTEPAAYQMVPYNQEAWVQCGAYRTAPAAELLPLWTLYNQQLMRIIRRIPQEQLQHRVDFENGYSVTLGWLIEDYSVHLEHHVRQITEG